MKILFTTKSALLRLEYSANNHHSFCCDEFSKNPMSYDEAREAALDYWESFFENEDNETTGALVDNTTGKMAVKWGNGTVGVYDSAREAANYILEVDGDHHGLDLEELEEGKFYELASCGQCQDGLPQELIKLWDKYHLKDLSKNSLARKAEIDHVAGLLEKIAKKYSGKIC